MAVDSILSAIAPQFDSEADRNTFISLASLRVNRCAFGDKADLAIAYMTAHMIAVKNLSSQSNGSAIGSVNSMKEGDISLSFHKGSLSSNGNGGDLSSTSFGKEFLILQNSCILSLGITGRSGTGDSGFVGSNLNVGGGFVVCD